MSCDLAKTYGDGSGSGYGSGSGSGYGYGSGDGYGSGSGSGYGYGSGDGYGSGSGDGYGYGYGYGSGSGYGYGYGSGDGSGSGYGSGDGYGSGYGTYLKVFLDSYKKDGCVMAFWRCNSDASPANGGGGGPRALGQVETIKGPLEICTENALHGTLDPSKWRGDRWWVVALHEPVQTQDDKIASLKREMVADLGKCPF